MNEYVSVLWKAFLLPNNSYVLFLLASSASSPRLVFVDSRKGMDVPFEEMMSCRFHFTSLTSLTLLERTTPPKQIIPHAPFSLQAGGTTCTVVLPSVCAPEAMLRNPSRIPQSSLISQSKRAFSTENGCECGCTEGEAFKPTLFNPTEEHFMLREMVSIILSSNTLGARFREERSRTPSP